MKTQYEKIANDLVNKIYQLIPNNPQILEMKDAWELFDIKGFTTKDIDITSFQASWALIKAKSKYEKLNK